MESQPDRSPYGGAQITATGGGKVFRATTAADGRYEVRVPPGEYEVRADVADGWYATVSFPKAQLLDTRGCVQSDVSVRPDGRISGRVEDGDGRPVAGLSVELVPVRAARESYVAPHIAIRTDESGRYEFTRLPPGRYYLGSTLRRQPGESFPAPLFYPGVRTITSAKEISLGVSERRPLDPFVVPSSYRVVRIQGIVRLPDGRPAANVKVYLKGGVKEYPLFGEAVTTGPDGRFSLLAAAGHSYRLTAELLVDGRVAGRIDSAAFNGEGGLAPFVLRLVPPKPPGW
jgi:5-hydroxyisourate hydrolase-like protein (transthyretin family)